MLLTPLECERVYFSGARPMCLTVEARGVTSVNLAHIFDERFYPLHTLELTGVPSARASHLMAAAQRSLSSSTVIHTLKTAFRCVPPSSTHRPANCLAISSSATRRVVAFDSRPSTSNFWGLTFQADSNR